MSTSRRRRESLADRSELARVARLYYVEDATQPQIARRMGVSVPTVSRALKRARLLGLVRIVVDDEGGGLREIERRLEEAFALRECVVVPGSARRDVTHRELAGRLAPMLRRLLAPGDLLGVSWGETLRGVGEALPILAGAPVDTVPILGAIGQIETGVYPNAIAQVFARKLAGQAFLVNTPGLVDSPAARKTLLADSGFRRVTELWSRVQVALLSVGPVDERASMVRCGVFGGRELADLRSAGAVCASNFNFMDADGRPVVSALSRRLIIMGADELRRVPARAVLAVGSEKVGPLVAALRGRLATILLTDEATALGCLDRIGEQQATPAAEAAPAARRASSD